MEFGCNIRPHYLFPGVIELIRYLVAQDHVEIAFFSAGSRTRNVLFVNRLLGEALDGNKLPYEPKIKSKDDRSFEIIGDNYVPKKNLRTMLLSPSQIRDLNNVILVDDLSTNAARGQEDNLLLSHSVSNKDFCKLSTPERAETAEDWDLSGIHQLNHIYYIAGVLQACITQPVSKPITTLLPGLQNLKEKQWYINGLSCLQRFNPTLRFNSHRHYKQTLEQIIPSSYIRQQYPCTPASSSSERVPKKPIKSQEKTGTNKHAFLNHSKRSRKHDSHDSLSSRVTP